MRNDLQTKFSYFNDFLTENCFACFQENFTLYSRLITNDSSLYPRRHLLISTTVCQHLCIIRLCSHSSQQVCQFIFFNRLRIGSLGKVGLASCMKNFDTFLALAVTSSSSRSSFFWICVIYFLIEMKEAFFGLMFTEF